MREVLGAKEARLGYDGSTGEEANIDMLLLRGVEAATFKRIADAEAGQVGGALRAAEAYMEEARLESPGAYAFLATAGFKLGTYDISIRAYEHFINLVFADKDDDYRHDRLMQHVLMCVKDASQTAREENLFPVAETVIETLSYYEQPEHQSHLYRALPHRPKPYHFTYPEAHFVSIDEFDGLITLRPIFENYKANFAAEALPGQDVSW